MAIIPLKISDVIELLEEEKRERGDIECGFEITLRNIDVEKIKVKAGSVSVALDKDKNGKVPGYVKALIGFYGDAEEGNEKV